MENIWFNINGKWFLGAHPINDLPKIERRLKDRRKSNDRRIADRRKR